MECTINDIKRFRFTGLLIGLLGGLLILSSLITEAYEISTTVGSASKVASGVSYFSDLKYIVIGLGLIMLCLTVLRLDKVQIASGVLILGFGIFSFHDIVNKGQSSDLSLHIGSSIPLLIMGAALVIISGCFNMAANNVLKKASVSEDTASIKAEIKKAVPVMAGLLVLSIIGTSVSIYSKSGTRKEAEKVTTEFLSAALAADHDKMVTYLSEDCNDKNGLMEAYTKGIIGSSYLSTLGVDYSELDSAAKQAVDATETYYSQSYLHGFKITGVKTEGDDIYVVKANCQIIELADTYDEAEQVGREMAEKFNPKTPEQAMSLIRNNVPTFMDIMNNSIANATYMDTEFTFKLRKEGKEFKIIEIDYKD